MVGVMTKLTTMLYLVCQALHWGGACLRRLHGPHNVGHGGVAARTLRTHHQRAVAVHGACRHAVTCADMRVVTLKTLPVYPAKSCRNRNETVCLFRTLTSPILGERSRSTLAGITYTSCTQGMHRRCHAQ